MVHISDLKLFYGSLDSIQDKNIYSEYLQYLILKKIFNFDFGFELYFAGDFYNRIQFGMKRFSNNIDLISDTTLKKQWDEINAKILESLLLEGYDVTMKAGNSLVVLKVKTDNLSLEDYSECSGDTAPITITINYFKTDFFFSNNAQNCFQSYNINGFDICTRINTIIPELAMTQLTKKIVKAKKFTPVEFIDLYTLSIRSYHIDKKCFNLRLHKTLLNNLHNYCRKLSKTKINNELSRCLIDESSTAYASMVKDRSWIKKILL